MDTLQEFESGTLVMSPDGVVIVRIREGTRAVPRDIDDMLAAAEAVCEGKKHPWIVDIRGSRSISREARVMLAGERAARITISTALIVASPVSRVIGSFFIGLNRTPFPTRVFTSEKQALTWLEAMRMNSSA